jgi:hypothetical protein
MTQRIAAYSVNFRGLQNPPMYHEFDSRRQLVAVLDYYLNQFGFSERSRRQINIAWLWRVIQSRGTPSFMIECQSRRGVAIEFKAC